MRKPSTQLAAPAVAKAFEVAEDRGRGGFPRERAAERALGYIYVTGTDETRSHRHERAVAALCAARGFELVTIARDVEAATGDRRRRPGLRWALGRLAMGEADRLVVAELRELSHTAAGLPPLLTWFLQHGYVLIAIDVRIDTSTAAGRLAAHALTDVGRWEQERISARTRLGLQAARKGGTARGRPSVSDVPELRERIRELRARGMTLRAIADLLNEDGIPTVRGGALWRPSSVQAVTGYRRPAARRRGDALPPDELPRPD